MLKNLLAHSSRYLTASVISALAALLMTKFYTTLLTPELFGIMVLYLMVFEAFSTLSTLSTEASVTRKVFDYSGDDVNKYFSTMVLSYLLLATLLGSLGVIIATVVSEWISPDSVYIYYVVLLAVLLTMFAKLFQAFCTSFQYSKSVSLATIGGVCINHPIALVVAIVFNAGVVARFSGIALGGVVHTLITYSTLSRKQGLQPKLVFSPVMLRETILLALPTTFSGITIIALSYADRVFLKEFLGAEAVGFYGLSLLLGKFISMIFEAISTALYPMSMRELTDDYNSAVVRLEKTAYVYYAMLFAVLLVATYIGPYLIQLLSSQDYNQANEVLPFVFIGIVFGGLFKIPAVILSYYKKIWFYLPLSLISFSINAGLNYILIPIYGLAGAGLSTCLGYLVYSAVVQIMALKYFSLKFNLVCLSAYLISIIWLVVVFV